VDVRVEASSESGERVFTLPVVGETKVEDLVFYGVVGTVAVFRRSGFSDASMLAQP
jgi:hypothetical protein